jgi:hypothetical protein
MKSENSSNQGFSYCFCLIMEGSGSIPLTNDLDLDQVAQKQTDLTDPEHWLGDGNYPVELVTKIHVQ